MAAACDSEAIAEAATAGLAVELTGLALACDPESQALLEGVDLTLARGECVLLEGETGSGKSTLLRAIAGLRGVERRAGTIRCHDAVVLLLQHVETQLLCPTVGEEVGLGLRNLGLSADDFRDRVRDALARLELAGMEGRETDRLSAGQKQRVVLAALLALGPRVLLLDEPFAALDAESRRALAHALAEAKRRGTALLIAEHAPAELQPIVDRRLRIEDRTLRVVAQPTLSRPDRPRRRPGSRPVSGLSLDGLLAGDRVLVHGPNGSGKSTLLQKLARENRKGTRIALVIQEPRRSLFARSVEDELAFSLDRRAIARGERDARIASLLERFDLKGLGGRSPRRLSFGQQHRLAIAAAIAARPSVVLLDEPFAGLDAGSRSALLAVLEGEQAEADLAYVIASHDPIPFDDWCHRVHDLGMPESAS